MTVSRLAVMTNAADFRRVLEVPAAVRTRHFALHHLSASPQRPNRPLVQELSTEVAPIGAKPVDDFPNACWFGLVVPKRLARRAVTRNLVKRQAREAMRRHVSRLDRGLWVLRLRAPLQGFVSAASEPLRRQLHAELDALVRQAAAPA